MGTPAGDPAQQIGQNTVNTGISPNNKFPPAHTQLRQMACSNPDRCLMRGRHNAEIGGGFLCREG